MIKHYEITPVAYFFKSGNRHLVFSTRMLKSPNHHPVYSQNNMLPSAQKAENDFESF